jgi:YHS domain-containing protein
LLLWSEPSGSSKLKEIDMKIARVALLVVVCGLTAGLAGCKSADKAEAQSATTSAPVNTICPIGGHEVDTTLTSSYQGKTIAFCCDGCKSDFDDGNTARKEEVLGRALANRSE